MPRLTRGFFDQPTLQVARTLLGQRLVRLRDGERLAGLIVETEAYLGEADLACHARVGKTPRTAVMYTAPGHAYVYFTYGMHHCLNLVTGTAGKASAVLVRALEPVEGGELMRERRGTGATTRLARGPGNVARALGLTRAHDGLDLAGGPLWLSDLPPRRSGHRIARGPRIGIRVALDRDWRWFLEGHPCVSAPGGAAPRVGRVRVRRTASRMRG